MLWRSLWITVVLTPLYFARDLLCRELLALFVPLLLGRWGAGQPTAYAGRHLHPNVSANMTINAGIAYKHIKGHKIISIGSLGHLLEKKHKNNRSASFAQVFKLERERTANYIYFISTHINPQSSHSGGWHDWFRKCGPSCLSLCLWSASQKDNFCAANVGFDRFKGLFERLAKVWRKPTKG